MRSKIYLFITVMAFTACATVSAQELKARVSVMAARVNTSVDKKIFSTLQTDLNNLLNNRKWTSDQFQDNEKIECTFILNIESILETNVYKATLSIQVARPVYHASYQAALVNFIDQDIAFKYVEFQPIEFNENRVQGTDALVANLPAVFAYYAYMIIGLDYDSFSPKGGDGSFRKAQSIVNNAPEGSYISGWRVFDGVRNRYWLNENLVNSRYNELHDVLYGYYREGLDNMYDNEQEARSKILQALINLQSFNRDNPNTMFLQFFLQTKATELIGIFKNGNPDEKSRVRDILAELDVVHASQYKQELG